MSMNGNQHAAQAVSRLRNGTDKEVARAGVEATLALAHEQRTANLIALMGWLSQHGAVSKDLAKQVDERLGHK